MARDFAKSFYSSKQWQDCRNGYAAYRRHLCEKCLAAGIITPGEIVHHKIEITPANIQDPDIALSWNNLELLCRNCHAAEHQPEPNRKRFIVDEFGRAIAVDRPPVSDCIDLNT